MHVPQERIRAFQHKILRWYVGHKRELPWRKTRNPYCILISEIMLQQTQVGRVVLYYKRFLQEFPTFEALAKADKITLLKIWQGLGYNNRALRLQQCAQQIMRHHRGRIPASFDALLELPGIGPYSARAVLVFAFNKETPVIDTNIRRALIHELSLDGSSTMQELEIIAQQCIPQGKSREWHNALMDYGALHATASKTGIASLSKQSTFEGSTRQVRSRIVRHLLEHKSATRKELRMLYPHSEFNAIVDKMLREGLMREKEEKMTL